MLESKQYEMCYAILGGLLRSAPNAYIRMCNARLIAE